MKYATTARPSLLLTAALLFSLTVSGCALLGLGAIAGAAVGGCAALDRDDDNRVTESELAMGIFSSWDQNGNGSLSEAEFDAGVERSDAYSSWSGDFDEWDANSNGSLSMSEFESGVSGDERTQAWLDNQCDDLGL